MKRLIHYYLKCLSVKCLCFKYALLYTFGLRNDYCFTVIILYFGNLICLNAYQGAFIICRCYGVCPGVSTLFYDLFCIIEPQNLNKTLTCTTQLISCASLCMSVLKLFIVAEQLQKKKKALSKRKKSGKMFWVRKPVNISLLQSWLLGLILYFLIVLLFKKKKRIKIIDFVAQVKPAEGDNIRLLLLLNLKC